MNETDGKAPATARTGRTLRVVLVLSLALNLLVLGVMAGAVFKSGQSGHGSHAGSDLRALWWALPGEARRDLRGAMGPRDDAARPTRDDRRTRAAARHGEVLALLRADPFDSEAFAAAIQAERSERAERIDRAHAAFVARVVALSASERAAMAERLETGRGQLLLRR